MSNSEFPLKTTEMLADRFANAVAGYIVAPVINTVDRYGLDVMVVGFEAICAVHTGFHKSVSAVKSLVTDAPRPSNG